jgi:endogenous inhibitor of DNA gyrase (YacG/DUF329 family)
MSDWICPSCGKKFAPDTSTGLPFCSERCRLIDLGRWLDENYSVPIQRDEEDEEQWDDEG